MNQWKRGHCRCSHKIKLKKKKTRRPTRSFSASRGGQAGFIFIHFHLPRLRQKLSFFCASRVCLGDMWRPGQCGCHVHGVSHSLHPLLHSHSNPAAQVCVGVCGCVCVCVFVAQHPLIISDLLGPPHSLRACASTFEHAYSHAISEQPQKMTVTQCLCVFTCKLNNVSHFEITRQQKQLCTRFGVKGSNYMLLFPAG